MLAMRSYFNFPEPCTDWGWLARRTQHRAGVSILGYKNTSSSFSSHFFQSLAFITNLCKLFRKQSWSEHQTESLELCGMSCTEKPPVHCHKSHLAHTDCSIAVSPSPPGTRPRKAAGPSWLQQGACQCWQLRSLCSSPSSCGQDCGALINKETDYKLS